MADKEKTDIDILKEIMFESFPKFKNFVEALEALAKDCDPVKPEPKAAESDKDLIASFSENIFSRMKNEMGIEAKPARRRQQIKLFEKPLPPVEPSEMYDVIETFPGDVILTREDAEKILDALDCANQSFYAMNEYKEPKEILEAAMKQSKNQT